MLLILVSYMKAGTTVSVLVQTEGSPLWRASLTDYKTLLQLNVQIDRYLPRYKYFSQNNIRQESNYPIIQHLVYGYLDIGDFDLFPVRSWVYIKVTLVRCST